MKGFFFKYGLALAAVLVGLFGRLVLQSWLKPNELVFVPFYPGIAIISMLFGLRPGLFATFLSGLLIYVGIFLVDGYAFVDLIGLLLFILSGVIVSVTGGKLQNFRIKEKLAYIANLEQVNKDLCKTKEQLTEINRKKNEFLYVLAHELRNPLAPMLMATSMLDVVCENVCHDNLQKAKDIIDRQVNRMSVLLNDLLDAARVITGKINLRKEIIDINQVLTHCLDLKSAAVKTRRQEVKLNLSKDVLLVYADMVRLEQIFDNLINNAIKFTDIGGYIEVRSKLAGSWVTVSIKDNGIGISAALLPTLFEMFTQANSRSVEGGMGIGLALCKQLIMLHDGQMLATSDGLGKGSEFVVKLLLAKPNFIANI